MGFLPWARSFLRPAAVIDMAAKPRCAVLCAGISFPFEQLAPALGVDQANDLAAAIGLFEAGAELAAFAHHGGARRVVGLLLGMLRRVQGTAGGGRDVRHVWS